MSKKCRFSQWALLAVLIPCFGCGLGDQPPERMEALVLQSHGRVAFDLPASKKPAATLLSEILVSRPTDLNPGAGRQVFWHVKMDNRIFNNQPRILWPLTYGDNIADTVVVVPAKDLEPGRYRFEAEITFADRDGTVQRNSDKTAQIEFEIGNDRKLVH